MIIHVTLWGKTYNVKDNHTSSYLTANSELAKEWAMCNGNSEGWLHTYEIDLTDLKIFKFNLCFSTMEIR